MTQQTPTDGGLPPCPSAAGSDVWQLQWRGEHLHLETRVLGPYPEVSLLGGMVQEASVPGRS